MFFDSWSNLIAIFLTGILAYIASIFYLRIAGKRSLSKWNAFDFIVTVALGSTLATIIMSKDITLIEGILAFGLLIGLQFIITWLSVRFDWVENLVKVQPTLLFDDGNFLTEVMRRQRVPEGEIRSAIRANGFGTVEKGINTRTTRKKT